MIDKTNTGFGTPFRLSYQVTFPTTREPNKLILRDDYSGPPPMKQKVRPAISIDSQFFPAGPGLGPKVDEAGQIDANRGRVATALGSAVELMKSGRGVDTLLLEKLARHGRDETWQQLVVGELAAAGVISGTAFEAITTDPRLRGGDVSFFGRLAFALAVKERGGEPLLASYTGWVTELRSPLPDPGAHVNEESRYGWISPMARIEALIDGATPTTPKFSRFFPRASPVEKAYLARAKALYEESLRGGLLKGSQFGATVGFGLPDFARAFRGSGRHAVRTALDAGATRELAFTCGALANRGHLDPVTFATLARPDGRPVIALGAARKVELGPVKIEEAVYAARHVAAGNLSFAQLVGYCLRAQEAGRDLAGMLPRVVDHLVALNQKSSEPT